MHKKAHIIVEMFSHCNLSCDFCYQKQIKVSEDKFTLIDKSIDSLRSILSQDELKNIEVLTLSIWGGELFNVNDQQILSKYKQLLDITKQFTCRKQLLITTNLIYEDLSLLKEAISYAELLGIEVKLSASFDFWGRFTSIEQVNLFYDNCVLLNRNIIIECLITRPAIWLLFVQGYNNDRTVNIFNKLYELSNVTILFNLMGHFHYKNGDQNSAFNTNMRYMLPNADDIVFFYKNLITKYPKTEFLQWYGKSSNRPVECECLTDLEYKQVVMFGEALPRDKNTCVIEYSKIENSNYEQFKDFSKRDLCNWFRAQFKCNICEYKLYCHSICVQKLIIGDLMNKCFMKEVFEFMDKKELLW